METGADMQHWWINNFKMLIVAIDRDWKSAGEIIAKVMWYVKPSSKQYTYLHVRLKVGKIASTIIWCQQFYILMAFLANKYSVNSWDADLSDFTGNIIASDVIAGEP